MTKEQAQLFAAHDPDYFARRIRGEWCVWSRAADHVVEFDDPITGRVKNRRPLLADYAPYHKLAAFDVGISDYMAAKYHNPFDGQLGAQAQVNAQAWDRGAEYAMRVMRFAELGHD